MSENYLMKRTLFLCCLLLVGCQWVRAQSEAPHEYTPLRSSGEIPPSFLTLSSTKVEAQKEALISGNESRKERKSKEQFLLQSNFVIDEMLVSGRVLFSDRLS